MAAVVVPSLGGCFPLAAQRLPQEVGAALAESPCGGSRPATCSSTTRRGGKTEAWRFLTRVEGCVQHLRGVAQVHNAVSDQKTSRLPRAGLEQRVKVPRIAGYESAGGRPDLQHARHVHAGVRVAARSRRDRLSRDHPLRARRADRRLGLVLELLRPGLHRKSGSTPGSTRAWPSITRPSCSPAPAGSRGRSGAAASPPASRAVASTAAISAPSIASSTAARTT